MAVVAAVLHLHLPWVGLLQGVAEVEMLQRLCWLWANDGWDSQQPLTSFRLSLQVHRAREMPLLCLEVQLALEMPQPWALWMPLGMPLQLVLQLPQGPREMRPGTISTMRSHSCWNT